MLKGDEWKNVMRCGVEAAHLLYTISMIEKKLLNKSIDKSIDMKFANYDTEGRLMKNRKNGNENEVVK